MPANRRRLLRRCSALATVALVATLLTPLPAAGAAPCLTTASAAAPIDRLAGDNRYATAACAATLAYPGGAAHVVLARGDAGGGLADALTGTVLAHAVAGPVLLTRPDRLPAETRAELVRLAPTTVTILGGTSAVSRAVADQVAALGPRVRRLSGADRAGTAAAVSAQLPATNTAFVVNGHRPADSLVAAAPAARRGAALLLTTATTLPDATATALEGKTRIVVVGGYGVVSDAVEARLRRMVGADRVTRVAGPNRSETAASVARAYPAGNRRFLTSGADANLVDAIGAGWLAALPGGGPVLYAERDRPGRGTDRYLRLGGLRTSAGGAAPTRLVGGATVLSDRLVRVLETRYTEAAGGGPPAQLRGVWIHLFDSTLKSRPGIDAMLDAAVSGGLNTVVVEVSRRQDAYYRSDVLPRTPDPALPADLDVLGRLVPAAHARGLQVHAWAPALPAYSSVYDNLNLGPDHVWTRHGPTTATPWTTRSSSGAQSTQLDPGVPGVQNHVAALYRELAARYDVDAIHTDYLRYEGAVWGYHPTSLARFRAVYGRTGTPSTSDAQWSEWRRRQTEDLARRIFLDVRAADPTVAVTMAASTIGASPASAGGYQRTQTYSQVFQDWPRWLSLGIVDAAFPMNYFRQHDATQRTWFNEWVSFEAGLSHQRLLAVGQGSWLNTVDGSLTQIGRAASSTDGAVLFSYQQTASSGPAQSLLPALASGPFAQPAPPPAMPWRDRPTAGHAQVRTADRVVVTARNTATGAERALRADATGRSGFVGLAPGSWRFSAPGYTARTADITAGQVRALTLSPSG